MADLPEEIEEDNVIALRSITGGRDTVNWLDGMEEGKVFFARKKDSKGADVYEFCVVHRTRRTTRLHNEKGEGGWVDSQRFSEQHELWEVIDG